MRVNFIGTVIQVNATLSWRLIITTTRKNTRSIKQAFECLKGANPNNSKQAAGNCDPLTRQMQNDAPNYG